MPRVWTKRTAALFLVAVTVAADIAHAGFDEVAQSAAIWLSLATTQNPDGSWGDTEDVRVLHTSAAVSALEAYGWRNTAYFRGVAWLENRAMASTDDRARRILALAGHGNFLAEDLVLLDPSRYAATLLGRGLGLSAGYAASPLDTALGILAAASSGFPSGEPTESGAYLLAVQAAGGDQGLPAVAGSAAASDIPTTAYALRAYAALAGAVYQPGAGQAMAFLQAHVTTGSPPLWLAHSALAVLRWSPAADVDDWLNALEASQTSTGSDAGSWEGDAYVTAVALTAMSVRLGRDAPQLREPIALPDLALRSAINIALGRSLVDAIHRVDMQSLTGLDGRDSGIRDLTGIEEAVNLQWIDLRGNPIDDLSYLNMLPNLTTAYVFGACDVDGDGSLGAMDLLLIARSLRGDRSLQVWERTSADVAPPAGPDGVVDGGDLLLLQRSVGGASIPACAN